MTESARARGGETLSCEACDARMDHEVAVGTDDGCYLCPGCDAKWREVFRACAHEWSPATNQWGEPSQVCAKCSAIVADEDLAALCGVSR